MVVQEFSRPKSVPMAQPQTPTVTAPQISTSPRCWPGKTKHQPPDLPHLQNSSKNAGLHPDSLHADGELRHSPAGAAHLPLADVTSISRRSRGHLAPAQLSCGPAQSPGAACLASLPLVSTTGISLVLGQHWQAVPGGPGAALGTQISCSNFPWLACWSRFSRHGAPEHWCT